MSFSIQEAVVQYEQHEQEVRDLQGLIEEAHRVIQDRPIPTNNIQELQAQILHHEVDTLLHTFDPGYVISAIQAEQIRRGVCS